MSTDDGNEHGSCTSYEDIPVVKAAVSLSMVDRQSQADLSDSESKSVTVKDNDVLTTLSRLKEKIGRLEMDRQEAENNMRKLANETLLFREQILSDQVLYSRDPREEDANGGRCDRQWPVPLHFNDDDNAVDEHTELRDFEVTENEDEFFIVSAREERPVDMEDDKVYNNTLDIVEDRCIALEREFQSLREMLSESDRVTSMRGVSFPSNPRPHYHSDAVLERREEERRPISAATGSWRLEKRLFELLGPDDGDLRADGNHRKRQKSKRSSNRAQSAELTRTTLEDECMRLAQTKLQSHPSKKKCKNSSSTRSSTKNSRSRSSNAPLYSVPVSKQSRYLDRPFVSAMELKQQPPHHDESGASGRKQQRITTPRVDGDRAKVRAIIAELHKEVEQLKDDHKALAHRLAVESNHTKKVMLVDNLDRIVNCMEQKGEQVGRLKSYMRRGAPTRIVVKPPKPFIAGSTASMPQTKEPSSTRNIQKLPTTLSIGDVRWTNAV